MSSRLLHSHALEIFCRIINTYAKAHTNESNAEKILHWPYTSFEFIEFALERFTTSEKTKLISNLIFSNNKEATNSESSSKFYEFVRKIKSGQEIYINPKEWQAYLKYIGDNELEERIKLTNIERFKPIQKEYDFNETYWWLYCYDVSDQKETAVVRSLLHIGVFEQAEIINYNLATKMNEHYIGKFFLYKDEYLGFEMSLNTNEKNLHGLIFIGPGSGSQVDFAVGQYHNVAGKIYSGTIIIKRQTIEEQTSTIQHLKQKNYNALCSGNDLVPKNINDYLSQSSLNYIEVPDKRISEEGLSDSKNYN